MTLSHFSNISTLEEARISVA